MDTNNDQYLLAIFNLLGALAYKMTGETPMLCVKASNGGAVHLLPDINRVTWLKEGEGWRCSLHDAPCGQAMAEAP